MLLTALLVAAITHPSAPDSWREPPRKIVEVLDAPPAPAVEFSPDGRWMLLVERPAMPSIEELARPWAGLAGTRVDVGRSMPQRVTHARSLRLVWIEDGRSFDVPLGAGARIGDVSWSPLATHFAFTLTTERGADLWACDVRGVTPRLAARGVNGVLGRPYEWSSDGGSLVVKLVPLERGQRPERPATPAGPATQETTGARTALRTYQDLLADEHDERLFAWVATSQLAWVELSQPDNATSPEHKPQRFGPTGMFVAAEPSPDREHLLVTRLSGSFSRVLPWSLFPMRIEVWNRRGESVRTVADVPLGDAIPVEGVRSGPRDVQWASSEGSTLVWVEALDGGDPARKAEARDRWLRQPAPFTSAAHAFVTLEHRARGIEFFGDPALALVREYDRDRRWVRARIFDRSKAGGAPILVDDRSQNDRYGDPGSFATAIGPFGTRIVRQDGEFLYRTGLGATKEGARPFLDRWSFTTQRSERLWRCEEGRFETVAAILESSAVARAVIATRHESLDSPPNLRLCDLQQGSTRRLTEFTDPQPALREVATELVRFQRQDGVELTGRLYLPPGRKAGERLPLLVWAYPREFSDAGTAGQYGGSPHRFVEVRGPSPILLALAGWAVLDEASMPVVGDPETVNDTFLQQITWNAEAMIAELERRGVADRGRVAVGGHSYGAFMTANLLAHTDLFRAGVARSGAYNRTLTPFGFQSERRTLWEAPKAYVELSPFLAAHKIDEPLLLIHGADDENTGTYPIQSERLFQAVQGNGGIARLVVLPHEGHGYRARESVLHCLAETIEWLDRHVRAAPPRAAAADAEPADASAPGGGR